MTIDYRENVEIFKKAVWAFEGFLTVKNFFIHQQFSFKGGISFSIPESK